jgi:hypothetical protein
VIRSRTDQRIFAALEFVDAFTNARIREPLDVRSDDATITRQPSGRYVVAALGPLLTAALREHADHFESVPAAPAAGSESIDVRARDRSRRYRESTFRIDLPRRGDPAAADSVMQAVRLPLLPTSAAPMQPNWTTAYVAARASDGVTPLAGARVALDTGTSVVEGLTDAAGQVVLALVGQPLFSLVGGNLRRTLAVTLSVRHDPDRAHTLPDTRAELARLAALAPLREQQAVLPTGQASSATLTAP